MLESTHTCTCVQIHTHMHTHTPESIISLSKILSFHYTYITFFHSKHPFYLPDLTPRHFLQLKKFNLFLKGTLVIEDNRSKCYFYRPLNIVSMVTTWYSTWAPTISMLIEETTINTRHEWDFGMHLDDSLMLPRGEVGDLPRV